MKSSLQVARSLVAILVATGLGTSAQARTPASGCGVAQSLSASAKVERLPVAAVDVEAHLKSRVVTSVTVGAPVEQAAPAAAELPVAVLKAVVAER